MTKISVVGPVFNEEECIEEFHRSLSHVFKALPCEAEFLFVDDGSRDRSIQILKKLRKNDPRVKILSLSRNFGHQIALKAGLDYAGGDAVILMDTDLQDPPEVIPRLLDKWQEGYDVVYAVREKRKGETLFKKVTAALYYRLMRSLADIEIPLDAGDFRLLSRRAADGLAALNEKTPYLRGLVSWMGFRQTGILIERAARLKGSTKFSLWKMLGFGWSGITHFSFLPLQLATIVGGVAALLCLLWVIHVLYVGLVLKIAVPGWSSIMIAVLFLGSVQLITLGILGSYLAKNYNETRRRPLYLIQESEGFPEGVDTREAIRPKEAARA